ncbi:uncharacterized protein LOC109853232 [Pseudomyrmex gracilis]|uniref:uncharacterized protein LOC109853232 n=1 Tax=Pseudomyrmex gracilis TaxID=219809 RepID=UPI000994DA70|nr:uncharacterized protein LOC109853232 [Pseudomyrmex gracilis]
MAPHITMDMIIPVIEERSQNSCDRPHEIEIGKPSRTELLSKWITNVRNKKLKCYRSPRRDLRVEAVLTRALNNAEYELRTTQLSRLNRWLKVRKRLLKGVNYGACGLYNIVEEELERTKDVDARHNTFWQEKDLCEDLTSLDNFLLELREIKPTIVQR